MLATRLATALVGLPILFGAVYLGAPWMAALATVAGVLAVFEYNRLSRAFDYPPPLLFSFVLVAGIIQAAVWGTLPFLMVIAAAMIAMGVFHFTATGPGLGMKPRLLGAMGVFHIAMPLGAAVIMRGMDNGLEWVLVTLLCTMAADTGAYAVGKLIGRRMLSDLSPNKTWEGTIGGVLAGVMCAIGLTLILEDLPMGAPAAAVLGVVIGVAAVVGDLVVSGLKRVADVKDTGAFLPGHGGFLDRMDSMLMTFPMAFLWVVATALWERLMA